LKRNLINFKNHNEKTLGFKINLNDFLSGLLENSKNRIFAASFFKVVRLLRLKKIKN